MLGFNYNGFVERGDLRMQHLRIPFLGGRYGTDKGKQEDENGF